MGAHVSLRRQRAMHHPSERRETEKKAQLGLVRVLDIHYSVRRNAVRPSANIVTTHM